MSAARPVVMLTTFDIPKTLNMSENSPANWY